MRHRNLTQFVSAFLVFLPSFVTPEESIVYDYDAVLLHQRVQELDGNFVMFFAPWCQHCINFRPIWEELAELVNTPDSKFAIGQVDCTLNHKLCHENGITGYPTLLYFHKRTQSPVEYKGTRDLPSLTLFMTEVFDMKIDDADLDMSEVMIYSGMSYLTDRNIEKFVSKGQHFVMFYAPWCRASQKIAPVWSELATFYAHNEYIKIGKVNCLQNEITCANFDVKQYPFLMWIVNGRIMGVSDEETLEGLKSFVEKMLLSENHDPEKFMKKKKVLPVARISEETFETFMEKDLVFVNYFAPWCGHCMQMSPLWLQLGEKFQNESRVLIADVDCVRSKPICEMEKISGLPTLILYKHKKIVSVEHGGRPLESLVTLVNEHLGKEEPAEPVDAPPKDEL